jgi:spore coat-associated protein N
MKQLLAKPLAIKLLASAALIGVTASIAGLGTFATFTDTTSASQAITSGTVAMQVGTAGSTANRLTVAATGLVAGDTVDRNVNLVNSGNQNLASIKLTTAATTSSILDTDATNGLQLQVDRCSVPWTETSAAGVYTYACSGTTTAAIATRAAIGSALTIASSPALTAGGTDYLRVRETLPTAADNTFQGKTSTIAYTFDSVQRASTAR